MVVAVLVEAPGLKVIADIVVILQKDGLAQLLEEVANGDGLLGRPVLGDIEEGNGSLPECRWCGSRWERMWLSSRAGRRIKAGLIGGSPR